MSRGDQSQYSQKITPGRNPSGAGQSDIDRRVGILLDRALRDQSRQMDRMQRDIDDLKQNGGTSSAGSGTTVINAGASSANEVFVQSTFPAITNDAVLFLTNQYPGDPDMLELWVNED